MDTGGIGGLVLHEVVSGEGAGGGGELVEGELEYRVYEALEDESVCLIALKMQVCGVHVIVCV